MKDNKGFSLVELIIVIAIMSVLVGILAPQFIKYIEQSRRSRDIQTADQIREAFLADIADGNLSGAINETPYVSGHVIGHGDTFIAMYNADGNIVGIFIKSDYNGSRLYNLTTDSGIAAYRQA